MTTDIKFDCTHCGQRMVVSAEAAGLATECPSCASTITIPKLAAMLDRAYQPAGRTRETMPAGVGDRRHSEDPSFEDPEIASLRQELLEASTQISRLEGELAELSAAAAASNQAAEQARASYEKLQAERRKLRDELVTFKKGLTVKEAELQVVAEARGIADARVHALSAELNKLEAALASREEELARLRPELAALTQERAELLPRLEATETEALEALETLDARNAELEQLRANLTETQAARTTALRDAHSLETRLAEVDAELTTARATIAQAEARLQSTADELASTQKRLADVDETAKSLTICVRELEKERDALQKSLSENSTGKDLVEAREHLRVTAQERDSLSTRVQQLSGELEASGSERKQLSDQLKTLLRELDEARRRAEAASSARLRQDNEVLRGIIARQNSELEQRHAQVVRLKRARLALRLAYAAFGMGLLAVAVWALRTVPGLHIGKLF